MSTNRLVPPETTESSLNDLLFDIHGNWQAIFLAMRRLAERVAAAVKLGHQHDRQDAIGDAVCHAMERLNRYHPERRCAEAYFYRILKNYLIKWASRQPRELHDLPRDDGHDDRSISLLDTPARPLERRHCSEYQRFDSRLTGSADIHRAKRLIDRSLARVTKLAAELPTTASREDQARANGAIDVLQEMRKELLGRYSRITADHARFRGTRRMETGVENDSDDAVEL